MKTENLFKLRKTTDDLNLNIALMIDDYEDCGWEKDFKHNISFKEAKELRTKFEKEAIKKYEELTKKQFDSKNFYYTAIIDIKKYTELETLEKIAKLFFEKCNFQCYHIIMFKRHKKAFLHFITLNKDTGNNEKAWFSYKFETIRTQIKAILKNKDKFQTNEEKKENIAKEAIRKHEIDKLRKKRAHYFCLKTSCQIKKWNFRNKIEHIKKILNSKTKENTYKYKGTLFKDDMLPVLKDLLEFKKKRYTKKEAKYEKKVQKIDQKILKKKNKAAN